MRTAFWSGLAALSDSMAPRNRALLARRDELQAALDQWHRERPSGEDYVAFLDAIGYLVPEGEPFEIETADIDPEIASIAGPQLVVPVTNARYAINAAERAMEIPVRRAVRHRRPRRRPARRTV